MKIKPTPEQVEACRYAGMLGHTHFALVRNGAKLQLEAETTDLANARRLSPHAEAIMTRLGKKRHLFRVA